MRVWMIRTGSMLTNHRCSNLHRSAAHQQRASPQVQSKDTIVVLLTERGLVLRVYIFYIIVTTNTTILSIQ